MVAFSAWGLFMAVFRLRGRTVSTKKLIDWEGVERDYRAGVRSVYEIARTFGCAASSIRGHAAKHGWARDLAPRIAEATAQRIAQDALALANPTTERAIIEANAELQANIVRNHRRDISRLRTLSDSLVQELTAATSDPLSARIDGTGKLANTLKTLIALERQAFTLDAKTPPTTGLSAESSELLRRVKAKLDEYDD